MESLTVTCHFYVHMKCPLHARTLNKWNLHCMVMQEEVIANASVVKTGRNLTVVAVEFKLKKTGNLLYLTHATFYNMPASSL